MPLNPVTIAKLEGMKSIIRVETPRMAVWYLLIPATGEEDATAVLLKKDSLRGIYRTENDLFREYGDRIIYTC